MTIIVHHLQRSASERIIWLLEELGVPYELKTYRRDFETLMAPPEYKALHPVGTSPIIQDEALTLAETSAIMEYILAKYGGGGNEEGKKEKATQLAVPPDAPNFVDYIYWLHWSIGSLQSDAMVATFVGWLSSSGSVSVPPDHPVTSVVRRRFFDAGVAQLDRRLRASPYLAGDGFTAADIYAVFTVTTMRLYVPFALTGYDGILAWLRRIAQRPAYKAMVEKAEKGEDRGVFPVLGAEEPVPLRAAVL